MQQKARKSLFTHWHTVHTHTQTHKGWTPPLCRQLASGETSRPPIMTDKRSGLQHPTSLLQVVLLSTHTHTHMPPGCTVMHQNAAKPTHTVTRNGKKWFAHAVFISYTHHTTRSHTQSVYSGWLVVRRKASSVLRATTAAAKPRRRRCPHVVDRNGWAERDGENATWTRVWVTGILCRTFACTHM